MEFLFDEIIESKWGIQVLKYQKFWNLYMTVGYVRIILVVVIMYAILSENSENFGYFNFILWSTFEVLDVLIYKYFIFMDVNGDSDKSWIFKFK